MTASQTITCYDNNGAASGTIVLYTAQLGNGQIYTPAGDLGIKLTSGHVTCQTGGAVMAANANIVINAI